MLRSLLTLCTFYMPIASVALRAVVGNGTLTQATDPTDPGIADGFTPVSEETDPAPWADFNPSFNATGQDSENSPDVSLEQDLGSSLGTYNDFPDQCLLWDNQCTGNRTEALDSFFNNSGTLYHVVYGAHCIWSRESECAPWLLSPGNLPKLLDWLRQPECVQSFYEYHTRHTDQPPWTWLRRSFNGYSTLTIDWNTSAITTSNVGCCRQCTVFGGNVDVNYWPVPGANTDCISTIGSIFKDPSTEFLVTDDRGYPYWKAQTNPWGQSGSQYIESIAVPPEQALAGGNMNPLSAAPSIQAREYRLNNITRAMNISNSEVVATIGNFRCTSPSVCIGFSGIYAGDECGALSTDGELITYTILAFAPEELSTIQVPAWIRASDPPMAAIRSFNFADLPCPPQSIMYAVEYKPAPGEPYRPVLSAPSRLSSLLPEWSKSSCIIPAALFNGLDPPRALKTAEILTPTVTQALPSASTTSVPAPASGIRSNEPSMTPSPSRVGSNKAPDPGPRGSNVETSDRSTPVTYHATPQKADPNPSDSNIRKSNSNNFDPQDINAATPGSGKGASSTTKPKSPDPESIGPKLADPSDARKICSQSLDGHLKPEEPQGSSSDFSAPDDPKTGSSDPDRSRLIVLGEPTKVADSNGQKSENLPSQTQSGPPPNAKQKDTSNSHPQETEMPDSDVDKPDSSNKETKIIKFEGEDAALSYSNKSPVTHSGVDRSDESNIKATDDELQIFHVLPTSIFRTLSPSAKHSGRQHDLSNDPPRDPVYQSENPANPLPGENQDDEDDTAQEPLSLSNSTQVLQTADLSPMVDLPGKTAPADDSTLSPQHSTHNPSKTFSNAIGVSPSKTTTVDSPASATTAVKISQTSEFTLSSASAAASALRLSDDKLSDSESQAQNVHPAASTKVKSSGTRVLLSRRQAERSIRSSVQEILYRFGGYVLPGVLVMV